MDLFPTEVELLFLNWQLDGPNLSSSWVILVVLVALMPLVIYVIVQFLILRARWSAALQLFSRANIIVPHSGTWWIIGPLMGSLVLSMVWWALNN